MLIPSVLIVVGLGLLIIGAELLVKGSASIAKKFGISSLVIGLTVVAFGTSAPELIVNMVSAFKGNSDIAIGNIIGSNTANILLILGIATMVYPLSIKKSTVWKEIPFALLAALFVLFLANDRILDGVPVDVISRTDGLSLLAVFVIFMVYAFGSAKSGDGKSEKIEEYPMFLSTILTVGGMLLLFFGGKFLVDNASVLARMAGLSEALIGLTIVAIGTSLPELATSVIAAYRHHDDIAIGNVVGSNIFNVFWILGITSVINELPVGAGLNFDIFFGFIVTLLLFLFMFVGTRRKLDRWQGVVFVCMYIGYTAYLIQRG